ncbi:MAG: zinc ribbon domain-containing protein [Methanomicrobiales archaeon]
MDNGTGTQEQLHIAKDHVAPLISQFSMVQNELARLFDFPGISAQSTQSAITWWQSQNAEQQYTYRGALAALASPLIIADIGINFENRSLVNTHAIIPSMQLTDPLYLFAEEDGGVKYKMERIFNGEFFINTLLLYLQGGAPIYEMEMKFEIPVRDFAVLLGIVDLRQRLEFRALLDHDVFRSTMKSDEIVAAVADGIAAPDPRWLLAFSLPMLHVPADKFSSESISQSVDSLIRIGLLQRAGETVSLTVAGERFAESAGRRLNSIRIDVYGAGIDGSNGRQSQLFIRGDSFLWYAAVFGQNGGSVVVAVVNIEKAEALLKETFSPAAVPKPVVMPASSSAAKGQKYCTRCGAPLPSSARFCRKCGNHVSNEAT